MERIRIQRREMTEFHIHELSAVDRPAQAHARMVIMKRDDDADRQKVLNLEHKPMSGTEQQHYSKLSGDTRRKFLLADHDNRTLLMAGQEDDDDDDEDEDTTMKNFMKFEDLQQHFRSRECQARWP